MCGVAKGRDEVSCTRVIFTSELIGRFDHVELLTFFEVKKEIKRMRKSRNDWVHHENHRELCT